MAKKKRPSDERDPGPFGREFCYINSYHGLKLKRGTSVILGDPKTKSFKKGAVAWDDRDGMIYILFEGDERADGPYRPNDPMLSYG